MNLVLDPAKLRGKRLFVGTPMYDGRCHAEFAFPLCQLTALCGELGIHLELFFFSGEALVMKARNDIADRFLRSDADHLMMIDCDIGFAPRDVIALLALQCAKDGENDYDTVCAPWPIKRIVWDKVARAVAAGVAAESPESLRHVAGDVLIAPLDDRPFPLAEPLEVTQSGTGFMMIRRRTLERFQEAFPHRRYRSVDFGARAEPAPTVVQFFDTEIAGQSEFIQREVVVFVRANPTASDAEIDAFVHQLKFDPHDYVSEDFMFCRLVRQIGMKVWTCPWINLTHTGSYTYAARLSEIARLAAS